MREGKRNSVRKVRENKPAPRGAGNKSPARTAETLPVKEQVTRLISEMDVFTETYCTRVRELFAAHPDLDLHARVRCSASFAVTARS